jgi:hypothetical protein
VNARPFSPETLARRIVKGGPNECWRWTGQHSERGYPQIMARGKPRRYLRISHIMLEEDGFPRPAGMGALHSCDNPWCINPAHLRWGTQGDNASDAIERGRLHRPIGATAPAAKLNDDTVREMRLSPESASWWARKLGISVSAACRAKKGATWSHV